MTSTDTAGRSSGRLSSSRNSISHSMTSPLRSPTTRRGSDAIAQSPPPQPPPSSASSKANSAQLSRTKSLEASLPSHGWDELKDKFHEEMERRTQAELVLQQETADLLEIFISWSQTTVLRDENRVYKRFKTRMDFVQESEHKLEQKKEHYSSVIKAFQSAMALLRDE